MWKRSKKEFVSHQNLYTLNDQHTIENVNNETSVTPNTKMNSPKGLEEEHIGKSYAVFWPKPKAYYWGRLIKVFSHDIEDDANEVEIDFLKKVVNSSKIKE